jgi:GDP-L-fucose synthase
MPTNLYGPGDNYHPENSHVIPALIRRFHEAKISNAPEVVIWGTGTPRREFLYVDDMASASVFVMELKKELYVQQVEPMQGHINVGSGLDMTIAELSDVLSKIIGYYGVIKFDPSRADGPPRKLMDSSRLGNLGWQPNIALERGLTAAYLDCVKHYFGS